MADAAGLFPHVWFFDQNEDPFDTDTHVLPLNDLRPHDLLRSCWCRPEEDFEVARVVIHNSLDRREQHQHGLRPAH
ncbi:MAG: hypothetical protein EOP35_04110 [Rubrivivax sp.]|nr:MAG: hypothetical protein EOP35_04110 [Rubrivivax sp.]